MILVVLLFVFGIYCLSCIKVLRQTERGMVETFGKPVRFVGAGLTIVFRPFQSLRRVDVTERMTDIEPQEIITKDNLNARCDLVVYYRVANDEQSIRNALYNVGDVFAQLDSLARTTARNVIGTLDFSEVNSERDKLNRGIADILREQISGRTGEGEITEKGWGVEVVRVELKEILPTSEIQKSMNQIIVANNEKRAAVDRATAAETEADGLRRARIKEADGTKQAAILEAEGKARAFELVNKSFNGGALALRRIEAMERSLQSNAKIVITEKGISPAIVLGNVAMTGVESE